MALWSLIAAAYVIPGVPSDLLVRLGDQYSTTPLWPWAVAACLVGIGDVPAGRERRFWTLLGISFAALIVLEIPWAFMGASDALIWMLSAEVCFCAFYAGHLAATARTGRGAFMLVALVVVVCSSLAGLALVHESAYHDGWASYLTYITFDVILIVRYWQCRQGATPVWRRVYTGLALVFTLVGGVDVVDLLWFLWVLPFEPGLPTDLLWTLPPLAFTLVVRAGRLDTAPGDRGPR